MRRLFSLVCTSCLILFGLLAPISSKADVRDKKTIITINAPVKIPSANMVLPAGTYVIKLLDIAGTRSIVQILSEKEDRVYTTALAIPNYRLQPSDKSEFTFWETPSGEPVALRSWFYPGDNSGVEFAYPRRAARDIARASKRDVPTVYTESQKPGELKEARVGATTPEGKETELAKGVYTAPGEQQEEQK